MKRFDPGSLDARDPKWVAALLPAFSMLNRTWLRLRVEGESNLPSEPALLVGNHNGGIMGPDLSCTLATLWKHYGPESPTYAMAHDFAMRVITPLGRVVQKLGCMRADPANALRVFERGGRLLVYPGGDLEAYRHYRDRNRIVFGQRTGFVRVAQRSSVPIVPIVAQGAHRSAIVVHEGEWIARVLRLDRLRLNRFPIALSLPWIIGAGPWLPYLPLPFPIRLRVLPPIDAPKAIAPAAIREEVVRVMQIALDEMTESANAQ
ncbi:1-acyl-sn-glycerol-3-phosphate acyltransferase [soil metagenome]